MTPFYIFVLAALSLFLFVACVSALAYRYDAQELRAANKRLTHLHFRDLMALHTAHADATASWAEVQQLKDTVRLREATILDKEQSVRFLADRNKELEAANTKLRDDLAAVLRTTP